MTTKPGKASVEPLPQVNPLYLIAVIHTILVPMNWTYCGPEVVPSQFLSVVCFAAPMWYFQLEEGAGGGCGVCRFRFL